MSSTRSYRSTILKFFSGHGGQGVWSIGENLAYPFMMFLATPLFLHFLGATQYGQWMLLLTFNGLGGVAGLGMGAAAIKEVSAHRGRGDPVGAADAVRSSLAVTLASSLALSALLIIIGIFFGPALLTKMGDASAVRLIITAAAILIALEQVDVVFAGAIRGCERFDLAARVEVLCKFTIVFVTVTLAWLTHSLAAIIGATIILTALRGLIKAGFASRLLGQGALWPRWHKDHVARVFAFGKWTWAQAIGSVLFATADRLIVGSMMGAMALAGYSVCLQLSQQVQAIPAAASYVLFPLISRKSAAGQNVRSTAKQSLALLSLLAAALALPLFLFGNAILHLWVGPVVAAYGDGVLHILVLSFALLAINNVPHYVLLGLNHSRIVAQTNIVAGVVSIAVCWWATPQFGLFGAAFGRLGYAIIICSLFVVMFRTINQSVSKSDIKEN